MMMRFGNAFIGTAVTLLVLAVACGLLIAALS